ncbi:MAG: MAPEG family protein [Hyphomicrobiales bacterium]
MSLAENLLLVAVFALVALAFGLLLWTGVSRRAAIMAKRVRIADIALDNARWPEALRQRGNAYANQFELPVLFYVLVVFLFLTKQADLVAAVLGIVFAASRYLHAWIHVTTNHVPSRFQAFLVGVALLITMWVWFALRLVLA